MAQFAVSIAADWDAVASRWQGLIDGARATPFQSFNYLDAWYRTLGASTGVSPVLVEVTDRATGDLVMLLPLIIQKDGARTVLSFADLDVSDFNAPILGPHAPSDPSGALALWRAITAALPACDVAVLRKMPRTVAGQINPLALLPNVEACELSGNPIALTGSWLDYHQGLERRVRMEFQRCWRVFQREPTARFQRVVDASAARAAITFLDAQQRARLTAIGRAFHLDSPVHAAFYSDRLAPRLAAGQIIMTTLEANGTLVAALYGISDGQTLIVLRIANVGGIWANVSPSRLLVHRTLEHAHSSGIKIVDLSIGDYDYKRRLGPTPVPLIDLVAALSWRGQTAAVKNKAVAQLRKFPAFDARLRRLLGRHRAGRTPPVSPL